MNQDKVKVKLSGISASMLGCLWNRAQLSKDYSSLFYDAKAVELAEKIDYDFSISDTPFRGIMFNISRKINLPSFESPVLRAKQFDDKIRAYIAENPRASVVSLATGLDATFYRVDNGMIHWYDLDLPPAIEVREQLLPKPDRVTYIAKSLLDPSWCKDIKHTEGGVFIIAGGVFAWFKEAQVKQFFSMLADNFPNGEIVFDAASRLDDDSKRWIEMFPQEQQDAIRAASKEAWTEAWKDWWERAPQYQKDKLNDMIAALKIPTKPSGREWADIEAWHNHLSDEEKDEVSRELRKARLGGVDMWTIDDVNKFTKWDNRIVVLEKFPLFKNIPQDSLSAMMQKMIDYYNESDIFNIIHLRV